MLVLESKGFHCNKCGEDFDVPDMDTMCPYCYSEDISVNVTDMESSETPTRLIRGVPLFYGTKRSSSYGSRVKKPIHNCTCYAIYMKMGYRSGYFAGVKDGLIQLTNVDLANLYIDRKEAEHKIYYANYDRFGAYPVRVQVYNNHVKKI